MTEPIDEENLLARFREWLEEARAESEVWEHEPALLAAEDHEVGLYRLVEEFTALRHELKLQTKSTRVLQEQTDVLLPALRQAMEQFRSVAPREAEAARAAGKPLVEALADLDEALDRGRVEIEKARHRLLDEIDGELMAALDALFAGQSWLRRRRFRSYHEQVRAVVAGHGTEARRALFDALLEGYSLIQSRLWRVMEAEELERIECLDREVDPERMTVVEVVDDPDRPPGEVVEEVRRGYTWQNRVIRYAEVRASRTPAGARDGEIEPETETETETELDPQ